MGRVRPETIRRGAAVALGAVLAAASCGSAIAGTGSRQTASARFVEQGAGVPTALTFSADYVNPDDPNGKPPAVRTVVETLAPDARYDTSVPAQCDASDAQLMAVGANACPPQSKVGGGFIRIDTGFPGPKRYTDVDVTFLNNANQLIFLSTSRDAGARVVSRAPIQGGRLTSTAPPALPGAPPDGGALDVVQTRLEKITREVGGVRRAYITTPSTCPAGGQWTNTLAFTYSDGVTQTVASPSACERRAAHRDYKAPRIRLLGVPRNRCATRTFSARVRIGERWSGLHRAELYLDRRRAVASRSKRFSRRIRPATLARGSHRLRVIAVDNAGNRSTATARFRRCSGGAPGDELTRR